MRREIAQWSRACHACQVNKVRRHLHSPILHILVPTEAFTDIHIDLVGPLPPSAGFNYSFTIIDRYSQWLEAIPLRTTTADDCAQALMLHWMAWFGTIRHLTLDRGPQFTSSLWSTLASTLGVDLYHTSAYHPQANGVVQCLNRILKVSLRARLNSPAWIQQLPWVLLGL